MELRCGSVIYALRHQPLVVTDELGFPSVLSVSDKQRPTLIGALAPQIHNSAKYVFDSGSDQDPETVQAVRDTAVNMMQFNLFHLPHPVMWIEDPFDDNEFKLARNYYLATEHKGRIDILLFQEMQPESGRSKLIINPHILMIDLTEPQDAFAVKGAHPNAIPEFTRALAEAVYSVKKLIVSLYTRGTIFEAVQPRQGHRAGEIRNRSYPHQIIRIPLHEPIPNPSADSRGTQSTTTKPRRAKLVRGYVWGYKTRPIDEQRWITAYWRNLAGEVPTSQSHYQIEARL